METQVLPALHGACLPGQRPPAPCFLLPFVTPPPPSSSSVSPPSLCPASEPVAQLNLCWARGHELGQGSWAGPGVPHWEELLFQVHGGLIDFKIFGTNYIHTVTHPHLCTYVVCMYVCVCVPIFISVEERETLYHSNISNIQFWSIVFSLWGFPGGSGSKESAYNAGDLGLIPG